jgi:hypothetical protein
MTTDAYGNRLLRYQNPRTGYEFTNRLRLEPEIEGSPMVGDLDTAHGTNSSPPSRATPRTG